MSGSKFLQYPSQTGDYSIKVKTGAGWRDFNTCRLQISVGQAYHEGAKMLATMQWVAARFEKVIVCVNDTLQRYNFPTADAAADKAVLAYWNDQGDQWLKRNADTLSVAPKCEVSRWEGWRGRPDYAARKQQVDAFYNDNAMFREAIDRNVDEFLRRNADMSGQPVFDSAAASKAYLLEETAVFSLMFNEEEAVDIYPGTVLLPATLFRGNPVPGMPAGLDKGAFTRIDFKRNSVAISPRHSHAA